MAPIFVEGKGIIPIGEFVTGTVKGVDVRLLSTLPGYEGYRGSEVISGRPGDKPIKFDDGRKIKAAPPSDLVQIIS